MQLTTQSADTLFSFPVPRSVYITSILSAAGLISVILPAITLSCPVAFSLLIVSSLAGGILLLIISQNLNTCLRNLLFSSGCRFIHTDFVWGLSESITDLGSSPFSLAFLKCFLTMLKVLSSCRQLFQVIVKRFYLSCSSAACLYLPPGNILLGIHQILVYVKLKPKSTP